METQDQPPKEMKIFADGGYYAWDEEPVANVPARAHRVDRWTPDESSRIPATWAFAATVYQAAATALAQQGITGLCYEWEPGARDFGHGKAVFPVEHFLHLAQRVRDGQSQKGMRLAEEIAILQDCERNSMRSQSPPILLNPVNPVQKTV